MTSAQRKKKYIIVPFFTVTALLLAAYSIFYYIFIIANEPVLQEFTANFLLPSGLSVVVYLIFLLPKINLLDISVAKKVITCMIVMVPVVVFVNCFYSFTFKKATINTVDEIAKNLNAREYKIAHFDIARNYVGEKSGIEKQYRKNAPPYRNFKVYFAAPLVSKDSAYTTPAHFKYWICKEYNQRITDDSIKKMGFDNFIATSKKDFLDKQRFLKTDHFTRIPQLWQKESDLEAINDVMYNYKAAEFVILKPEPQSTGGLNLIYLLVAIVVIALNQGILLLMVSEASFKKDAFPKRVVAKAAVS